MDHIEIIIAASIAVVIGGLLMASAYSSHINGEIVKAAIEAKVDAATMCMLTKR